VVVCAREVEAEETFVMTKPPSRADIESAAVRLRGKVRRTPVLELHGDELGIPARVVLKLELTQHTGSFKARGALNSVLSLDPEATGVVAASGGNHGIAVAWAASRGGVKADIFVPDHAPQAKVDQIRAHEAQVHLVSGFVRDALDTAMNSAADTGAAFIHPYDQFNTVAGAGTVGLEIEQQVPDADRVLVACGGGGLYAGVATALTGVVPVTPVEPTACPSLASSLEAGTPVPVEVGGVAVDSLGAGTVGSLAWACAQSAAVEVPLVSDDDIVSARLWLWQRCRVLAEPGACVPMAALMSGATTLHPGDTVVVVVSGGNDPRIP
jgi:threonine dehydratase